MRIAHAIGLLTAINPDVKCNNRPSLKLPVAISISLKVSYLESGRLREDERPTRIISLRRPLCTTSQFGQMSLFTRRIVNRHAHSRRQLTRIHEDGSDYVRTEAAEQRHGSLGLDYLDDSVASVRVRVCV